MLKVLTVMNCLGAPSERCTVFMVKLPPNSPARSLRSLIALVASTTLIGTRSNWRFQCNFKWVSTQLGDVVVVLMRP